MGLVRVIEYISVFIPSAAISCPVLIEKAIRFDDPAFRELCTVNLIDV
jgi:hypothetical protein